MRKKFQLENEWRRFAAVLCFSAVLLLTAVLATRLPTATAVLSPAWTLATALVLGGLGAAGAAALHGHDPKLLTIEGKLLLALAISGCTTLATIATARHGSGLHIAFASLLSLACSMAATLWASSATVRPAAESSPAAATQEPTLAFTASTATVPPVDDDQDEAAAALPDHVDQTLSRYSAEGRDHLEACLRVRFEPGQQTAIVHLPIQPAMHFDPEVECEPIGSEELRITVDPAQPYGVRLVCRRPAPCTDAAEAIVAVLVSSDRMARAAA